jgi:hypothetical protein
MCRQVDGCYSRVGEYFIGTEGVTNGNGGLKGGKDVAVPEMPTHNNPQVQEHMDLLRGILKGEPLNEARNVAEATMGAVMGRISAYTGQVVRWVDVMSNETSPFFNLTLQPTCEAFESGAVTAPADDVVPIPGNG